MAQSRFEKKKKNTHFLTLPNAFFFQCDFIFVQKRASSRLTGDYMWTKQRGIFLIISCCVFNARRKSSRVSRALQMASAAKHFNAAWLADKSEAGVWKFVRYVFRSGFGAVPPIANNRVLIGQQNLDLIQLLNYL